MKEHTLTGSNEKENIDRRIAFLTELFKAANRKSNYIGELRQRNLNYAIVIFAALFTFTMKFSGALYSVFVSIALLCIMIVFCLMDLRFHKYIHGWRRTQTVFMQRITDVINDPAKDVSFRRYCVEGEKGAEIRASQPMIFYSLVFVGLCHFFYILVSTMIK